MFLGHIIYISLYFWGLEVYGFPGQRDKKYDLYKSSYLLYHKEPAQYTPGEYYILDGHHEHNGHGITEFLKCWARSDETDTLIQVDRNEFKNFSFYPNNNTINISEIIVDYHPIWSQDKSKLFFFFFADQHLKFQNLVVNLIY